MQHTHTFVLALYRSADGACLGSEPLTAVDWEPAIEWTRWAAVQRGDLAAATSPCVGVAPVWDPDVGEPHVRGFRVRVGTDPGFEHVFRNIYFAPYAQQAANVYVQSGELEEGSRYRYRTLARPQEAQPPPPAERGFVTSSAPTPLRLRDATLPEFLVRARCWGEAATGQAPLFIPREILAQADAQTRQAGDVETGGILVGHLHRNAADGAVFMQVTALVPARGARADATSLHFTPEVWSHVHAALELRGAGEIWLGWFHSHPVRVWCRKCAPEKQAACSMRRDFFSDHDHHLHRSVFPAAYSVALVVNDTAEGLSYSCFGWQEGVLVSRGFHVLDDAHALAGSAGAST